MNRNKRKNSRGRFFSLFLGAKPCNFFFLVCPSKAIVILEKTKEKEKKPSLIPFYMREHFYKRDFRLSLASSLSGPSHQQPGYPSPGLLDLFVCFFKQKIDIEDWRNYDCCLLEDVRNRNLESRRLWRKHLRFAIPTIHFVIM